MVMMVMDTDTIPTASSSGLIEHHPDLFIIQKCWYDGPHLEAPVDCRRLFTDQSTAEQEAARAAHAYTAARASAAHQTTPRPVRTVLLREANVSSYAFATCGKLFWVRRVSSTMLDCCRRQHADRCRYGFCLTTDSVVGGTGNRHSRRGSERRTDCVAVECQCGCSPAWQLAQRWLSDLSEQQQGSNVRLLVERWPLGGANDSGCPLSEWPDVENWSRTVITGDMVVEPNHTNEMEHKRRWGGATPTSSMALWWGTPSDNSSSSAEMHAMAASATTTTDFLARPAKRPCITIDMEF